MNYETLASFGMMVGFAAGYTAAWRLLVGGIGRGLSMLIKPRAMTEGFGRFAHG